MVKNDLDESKPKNLTTAQKREVYANNLDLINKYSVLSPTL